MTRRELRAALAALMGSTEPADLALRAELTEELGARLRDAALADRERAEAKAAKRAEERAARSTKAPAHGLAARFPIGARTGDPRTCPLCLQAPAERAACWHGRR